VWIGPKEILTQIHDLGIVDITVHGRDRGKVWRVEDAPGWALRPRSPQWFVDLPTPTSMPVIPRTCG
jgi:hypothetical protein